MDGERLRVCPTLPEGRRSNGRNGCGEVTTGRVWRPEPPFGRTRGVCSYVAVGESGGALAAADLDSYK